MGFKKIEDSDFAIIPDGIRASWPRLQNFNESKQMIQQNKPLPILIHFNVVLRKIYITLKKTK